MDVRNTRQTADPKIGATGKHRESWFTGVTETCAGAGKPETAVAETSGWTSLSVKNSEGTHLSGGNPTLLEVLPLGTRLGSHSKYQTKPPSCFWQVEGKRNYFEIHRKQSTLFF